MLVCRAKAKNEEDPVVNGVVGKGTATDVEQTSRPMNLVFVAAEVAPWSKTGGLGDVLGGLPIELARRGHKVMSIAPRYDQYRDGWDTNITVKVLGETVRFFHCHKKGVDRVFVDHPWFLAKVWGKTGAKLYGKKSGSDYADNQKRFRLFCEAAIEATRALPFGPGEGCTFVANDWHSALVPVLLKDVYQPAGQFTDAKVAFCVHNVAFQGRFWREDFSELALPAASLDKFAFADGYPKIFTETEPADEDEALVPPKGTQFEKVNWMRAGFLSADKNFTVSPNYAEEVSADAEKGVELNDVIVEAGIEGIVNGMDETDWNPATDKFLDVPYDKDSVVQGKASAKEALQAEAGLPVDPSVPLFGFIGRLEEQKGVDIMLKAIPKLLEEVDCQVVVLGTGKKKLEKLVKQIDEQCSEGAKGVVKFSSPMAHMITAGADYMLVPSRFEPCGLIQLHAMHYGTVPVVATTGGLVDTVKEGVTGFHMGAMDPDNLLEADVEKVVATCAKAAGTYGTPAYGAMSAACIAQDLTWSKPAKKWEAALEELNGFGPKSTSKKEAVEVPIKTVAAA